MWLGLEDVKKKIQEVIPLEAMEEKYGGNCKSV